MFTFSLQVRRPQSVTSDLPRVGVSELGDVLDADGTSPSEARNGAIHVYSHPRAPTDSARSRSEGSRLNTTARSGASSARPRQASKSAADVSSKTPNPQESSVCLCFLHRCMSRNVRRLSTRCYCVKVLLPDPIMKLKRVVGFGGSCTRDVSNPRYLICFKSNPCAPCCRRSSRVPARCSCTRVTRWWSRCKSATGTSPSSSATPTKYDNN